MRHNQDYGDNLGPLIVTMDTATATKATQDVEDDGEKKDAVVLSEISSSSPLHKLKSIFQKKDKKTYKGPTIKEKLAKMGLSALISFFISFFNWFYFVKQTIWIFI